MGDPLEVKPLLRPRHVSELAPEAKAFRGLKATFKRSEGSRVVGASFCPTLPTRLALVSGTKVGLWNTAKEGGLEEGSSLTKFKDLTQCAAWRSDGRLMLVGEASGTCAVIEMETRSVLRRLRGHGDAVTCAAFAEDKSRCATGCKDGKLRLWDVASCELLQEVEAHDDCLKCLSAGPVADSWITAGYDKRVKLWDPRVQAKKAAISVDHGHPVEAGCAFPSAALFASAGGSGVKVWDLAMTGKALSELQDAHSKVVMGLCLDSKASTLLTASFDGLAKVYHAADLSHVWTYTLPGPATCIAWRPDDRGFVVGLDSGQWQYRSKAKAESKKPLAEVQLVTGKRILRRGKEDNNKPLPDAEEEEESDDVEFQKTKKWKREEGHLRGHLHRPSAEDEVIERPRVRKKRESKVDYLFRKYEYRKLAEYLFLETSSHDPSMGLAVADELLERGALATAMCNLSEELCLAALRWLLHAFAQGDSLQQLLYSEVLHTLVDCNSCLQPPRTPQLLEAVRKLDLKVLQELSNQESLFETNGAVESIFV
ncbi:unnamed protein product [Effrenium voratum]|uniref:U3 small nucleolar RNA-associated protein 15 C-terminal domain-containing protein n=1 Tax=Effrenium voratum TaxID=2562239 RepID=A0AA36IVA2_9DINO|nr:unnamed protein product [Effrenium voratum]CAJ1454495.1 unnamed protein product [Effrenium voratum]